MVILHLQLLISIVMDLLDPIESNHNLARSSVVSMFTEPYTLPSSHVETPISDRNRQGTTKHRRFNMCWHVVWPFYGVPPWSRWTLWDNATKKCFSVKLDIGVIVLIDSQRSAGVLQEQMCHAALELGEVVSYPVHNLGGDEVAAAALRRDDDGPLGPAWGQRAGGRRRRGDGELAPDGAGAGARATAGPRGDGGSRGDDGRSPRGCCRLHH